MSLTIIDINASAWRSVLDFYEDVVKRIGAPDGHGRNVNALVDSMIYGGINALEPPYVIRFHETDRLSNDIAQELLFVRRSIADARLEQLNTLGVDTDVAFEII